jgi:hypothetical protein
MPSTYQFTPDDYWQDEDLMLSAASMAIFFGQQNANAPTRDGHGREKQS